MERGDGSGLAIHPESKATVSQRRHPTRIPRARDQEEDKEAVGEEPERKMWKEVKIHGQRSRRVSLYPLPPPPHTHLKLKKGPCIRTRKAMMMLMMMMMMMIMMMMMMRIMMMMMKMMMMLMMMMITMMITMMMIVRVA